MLLLERTLAVSTHALDTTIYHRGDREKHKYHNALLTQIIIIHAGGAVKGEIKQKAGTNPAFCCTGNTAVSFELRARKSLPITRTRVSNARSRLSCAARLLTWIIIIHAGGAVKRENELFPRGRRVLRKGSGRGNSFRVETVGGRCIKE